MSVDAVLIAGPTASGKSAAALELAERLGGIVINADSMQVYRELRVLTARPPPEDEARVPHRLYGYVPAVERYSAGLYQAEAARVLSEARAQGRAAIFTGGTGLYFHALEGGLSPIPAVPADIRDAVRKRFDEIGREAFFAELQRRDPAAARLHSADTQRLLRAANVLEATGRPLSAWQEMSGKPVLAGLRVERFVIAPARGTLSARIDRRFEAMVRNGALDEARALSGLDPALPAARALGLRELTRHLNGEISLDAAIADAQMATKRYVKRQLTWFRQRMGDWKWLESNEDSNFVTNMWQ